MKDKPLVPSQGGQPPEIWDDRFRDKWRRDQQEREQGDSSNEERPSNDDNQQRERENWDDSRFRDKWRRDQQEKESSNEEQSPQEVHEQPENQFRNNQPQPGMAYAGFWRRVAAFLIDGIILAVAEVIIFFIITVSAFSSPVFALEIAAGLIPQWLYFTLFESSEKQATLGKRAIGIFVTDLSGNQISFGKANGRYWGKLISSIFIGIGYVMAAFTKRKQALHDIMAGTLVVKHE